MQNLDSILNPNLRRLSADPIRNVIANLKSHGFDPSIVGKDFTIGVPAPLPELIAYISADAAEKNELGRAYGYPPFLGNQELLEMIIEVERLKGTGLQSDDYSRMSLTAGASGGLELAFSLLGPNKSVLVQSPAWGTVYNFIADSGNIGLPVPMFTENGEFDKQSMEAYLQHEPVAVYINLLNNPNPVLPSERGYHDLLQFVEDRGLVVISDDPYMFTMFNQENISKYSILNANDAVRARSIKVGSLSKVTKPEDRIGYVVVGEDLANVMGDDWKMRVRNQGAGIPAVVQASAMAILRHDPQLRFLQPNIQLYQDNFRAVIPLFQKLGCTIPEEKYPDGAYFVFARAPNERSGEEFAFSLARETGIGVIPGSSFLPHERHYSGTSFENKYRQLVDPFEDVLNQIRIGFAGAATPESIGAVLSELENR